MTTLTAATRLALRQAVEPHSEEIVKRAEQTLSEERMTKLRRSRMKVGQLNNLFGVTMETSSPTVVINWVRYQMGRKERDLRGWSESGLGDCVVKDIEGMKPSAQEIAQEVFADPSDAHVRQAHIALVRLYAGYLKRWFVAKGGQK